MRAETRVLIKILSLLAPFVLIIIVLLFVVISCLFRNSIPTVNPTHTNTISPTQSPTFVPPTTPAPLTIPTTSTIIPTPKPTSPPTVTPCTYGVTLYGTPSPEVWLVNSSQILDLPLKNTGTCSWPKGTSLELISPDLQASIEEWPQEGELTAGGLFTARINLTAPSSPQTLILTWQLKADEQTIGSAITHTLRIVLQSPTSIPTPTLTPIPTNKPSSPTQQTSIPPAPTRATQQPPPPTRVTITPSN